MPISVLLGSAGKTDVKNCAPHKYLLMILFCIQLRNMCGTFESPIWTGPLQIVELIGNAPCIWQDIRLYSGCSTRKKPCPRITTECRSESSLTRRWRQGHLGYFVIRTPRVPRRRWLRRCFRRPTGSRTGTRSRLSKVSISPMASARTGSSGQRPDAS